MEEGLWFHGRSAQQGQAKVSLSTEPSSVSVSLLKTARVEGQIRDAQQRRSRAANDETHWGKNMPEAWVRSVLVAERPLKLLMHGCVVNVNCHRFVRQRITR
jgi:hypothetical protein